MILVVFLFSAAVRISSAWSSARIADPDAGVVAIMARRMALGQDFPVFFYGQAYMGTIEPVVSALLCRLFGISGFAVNLGTAFFALLLIPCLWRWGRALGGPWGGLFAALLCATGPPAFAWYMVVPRGGYAAATWLQLVALTGMADLSVRLHSTRALSRGYPLLLGAVCGLAWWTHPITTSGLIAAGLVFLIGTRGRPPRAAILALVIGFLAGSAPFWWWNSRHGWASFEMLRHLGTVPWARGFRLWLSHWLSLFAAPTAARWTAWLHLALFVLPAAVGLVTLLTPALRHQWTLPFAAGLGLAIHTVLANLLYMHSAYVEMRTERYLVPMLPGLALLGALGIGAIASRRTGPWAVAAAVLILLPSHVSVYRQIRESRRKTLEYRAWDQHMAGLLEKEQIEAVYAHFHYYGFNFALDERHTFTSWHTRHEERLPDYARRAERADRVAFLDNRFGAKGFALQAGGQSSVSSVGPIRLYHGFIPPSVAVIEFGGPAAPIRLYHGFIPPSDPLEEVPVSRWECVQDLQGTDLGPLLADRDEDTAWSTPLNPGAETGLTIRFQKTERPVSLRLCVRPGDLPRGEFCIERFDEEHQAWQPVRAWQPIGHLHWSGVRPYFAGRRFRLEFALGGLPTRALRWRMRIPADHRTGSPLEVYELQVFEAAHRAEPPLQEAVVNLICVLRERQARRVYADRWESNRIAAATPEILVEDEIASGDGHSFAAHGIVDWRPGTALVVREHDAPQTRDALLHAGLSFQEIAVSPWRIFEAIGTSPSYPPVFWSGYTLFKGQLALRWNHLLETYLRNTDTEEGRRRAVAWLGQIRSLHPEWLSAAEPLLSRLQEWDPDLLPADLRSDWEYYAHPTVKASAEFEGGLKFLGLRPERDVVRPGDRLRIRYYWQCPPDYPFVGKAAFVHFQAGALRFQDDHELPLGSWRRLASHRPPTAIFTEDRIVEIPASAPDGPVSLMLGVYHPKYLRRDRVRTDLKTRRRAICLPRVLEVSKTTTGDSDGRKGENGL